MCFYLELQFISYDVRYFKPVQMIVTVDESKEVHFTGHAAGFIDQENNKFIHYSSTRTARLPQRRMTDTRGEDPTISHACWVYRR